MPRSSPGESVPPVADPVFVGPGGARLARITTYTVDVPVLPDRVRLDDAPVLQRQVQRAPDANVAYLLSTDSQLPAALGARRRRP